MNSTYLVQRLVKPYISKNNTGDILISTAEYFSFGGGLKNGGLSEDAMKMLRPIFSFDYMGSAEFEFGAVPDAFRQIAKGINESEAFELEVKYKAKNWKSRETVEGKKKVYIICHKEFKNEVIERIKNWAVTDYNNTKAVICFNWSLAELARYENIIGWLELDNGFIFFKDKEAFEKTKQIFGLQ